jgi:hypothetical protein
MALMTSKVMFALNEDTCTNISVLLLKVFERTERCVYNCSISHVL